MVINKWIFLFVQSNDYNHKKGEIPLQRRFSLDTRKGFVEKCFPSLLPGRPSWGTPASGMGSHGKHFVPSLLPAARSTASGSAPSHSAGQSPRGGRTMPRPRQIAVGARGTAESPCNSFRTARERSDTSAHWLASLAPRRAASWDLWSALLGKENSFPVETLPLRRLAGFRSLFIVVLNQHLLSSVLNQSARCSHELSHLALTTTFVKPPVLKLGTGAQKVAF